MYAASPRIILHLVERIGPRIQDLHRSALQRDPTNETAGTGADGNRSLDAFRLRQHVRSGGPAERTLPQTVDDGLICAAEPDGGISHHLKYRLKRETRTTDDLQHIAGRGLVFQRFLKIVGAPP
jgi:hypothetical protein